jgi:hypothetical protein
MSLSGRLSRLEYTRPDGGQAAAAAEFARRVADDEAATELAHDLLRFAGRHGIDPADIESHDGEGWALAEAWRAVVERLTP